MPRLSEVTVLIFLLFSSISLCSQSTPAGNREGRPLRIEIPARSDAETYRVVPFGQKGFILFFRSTETVGDTMVKWYFSRYSAVFQQTWIRSVAISGQLELHAFEGRHDTLILVFRMKPKEKSPLFSHSVLQIPVSGEGYILTPTLLPEDHELTAFGISGRHVCFGLSQKNKPATIQVLDLSTGKSVLRTLSSRETSTILSFTPDTANNRMLISLKKQFGRNAYENYLVLADPAMNSTTEILVSPITPNCFLRDLSFLPVGRDEFKVFGTFGFGDGQRKSSRYDASGDLAGLFYCTIRNGEQHGTTLTNFIDLKNVNGLLGEKDILTLKKKEKKQNGTREYSLNLDVLAHPVQQAGGKFIVFLESFTPEYQSETYTDFDYYGRPYTVSVPVFMGYRYLNGIAAAYDHDGKVLWDNNIEVRNLRAFDLVPRMNITLEGSKAVLSYISEGRIGSKITEGNLVSEPLDFAPVELYNPEDKLLTETKSCMVSWYDDFYLCYGYQEIKNIALQENNTRMVFYMTKIRYEP